MHRLLAWLMCMASLLCIGLGFKQVLDMRSQHDLLQASLKALQADFEYNLEILDGRDAELEQYDIQFETLSKELAAQRCQAGKADAQLKHTQKGVNDVLIAPSHELLVWTSCARIWMKTRLHPLPGQARCLVLGEDACSPFSPFGLLGCLRIKCARQHACWIRLNKVHTHTIFSTEKHQHCCSCEQNWQRRRSELQQWPGLVSRR